MTVLWVACQAKPRRGPMSREIGGIGAERANMTRSRAHENHAAREITGRRIDRRGLKAL